MPSSTELTGDLPDTAIAVVGSACHLPGAMDVARYWQNLRHGVESIRFFTDEELVEAGIPAAQLGVPGYVKASPVLDHVAGFDPAFWGISPKDAAIMDPQHRHFLECAHEALEDAGQDPRRFDGTVGVFGGCGANSYLMLNLLTNPQLVDQVGMFLLRHTSNDKDFLTTFTSYQLGLDGPSVGVQTACSTSLVAIHVAAQSLLNGECDMALAGGSTVELPHLSGYRFQEGEILSPDGHCRPFDAASAGTVFGSGAGMVVLRRLSDALADGDDIRAVIRGSAINNDGDRKAGFLAPSVDGQAHAVAEALAIAEVDADSIRYVECHGTGTPVGDPIEVAALSQAFRETTDEVGFCSLGSVKSNIGHTDTAAGVASFLKVVEALRHAELPPSLHFERPNPLLELEQSPFRVQSKLEAWPQGPTPRRAGVSSTGVGGTNAHVVLEESPNLPFTPSARQTQLLPLAAKTPSALTAMAARLADALEAAPERALEDVAFTLQVGRTAYPQRRAVSARNTAEAIRLLRQPQPQFSRLGVDPQAGAPPEVSFLLPGGGSQYVGMAGDLYRGEPVFREVLDRGFAWLTEQEKVDLKSLLFGAQTAEAQAALERPSLQLPAIFLVEAGLAALWMSWGVQPAHLLGHSLGENTAAYLAGVFSFEDALGLVSLRGRLFEKLPAGGMLSVVLDAKTLAARLPADLVIGVHNGPEAQVVSGPPEALEQLQRELEADAVECRVVPIDCAAHSPMLEPILDEFRSYLQSIPRHAPKIPLLSNRSGTWMTNEEATDPDYWVAHLRNTVRFDENLATLLQQEGIVLLEVGPGKALGSLARQQPDAPRAGLILSSLRHPEEKVDDQQLLLANLGQLWCNGILPDWQGLQGEAPRRRTSLPTYPFERQDYWIEPGAGAAVEMPEAQTAERLENQDDWFSHEAWRSVSLPEPPRDALSAQRRWLLFLDRQGLGQELAARLREAGQEVITVQEGDTFYRFNDQEFALSPEAGRGDYDALIRTLHEEERLPHRIVHFWAMTGEMEARPGSSMFHHNEERGFYSLFFLAQALGELDAPSPIQCDVVSDGLHKVRPSDVIQPEKALLLGPIRVIPREYDWLQTRSLDLDFRPVDIDDASARIQSLWPLLLGNSEEPILAIRDAMVFAPSSKALDLPPTPPQLDYLPHRGVVLITGGLGGLGLTMAEHLASRFQARLVLQGRSSFPPRDRWDHWLKTHTERDHTSKCIHRLRAVEQAGAEVLVVQGDVANLEDNRALLEQTRRRFGALDGVIHAAGILEDGVIQMRTPEAVERVFTPKVHGTVVLRDLLRDEPLRFFLLCSSTSVALGPAGQVDYVAANAFLNALASAEDGKPGPRMMALNWGIWSEVGMAKELAEKFQQEAEPSGERQRMEHPWFEERILDGRRAQHYRGTLHARQNWVLDEHRLQNGRAVLPGTAYLDVAAAALRDCSGHDRAKLSDVQFLAPCEVPDDAPRELEVQLHRDGKDYTFQVRSRDVEGKEGWLQHALGKASIRAMPAPETCDLEDLRAKAERRRQEVQKGSLPDPQDQYLRFGPRFQCHQAIGYGPDYAYARLRLPEAYASELTDYPLHPALLDIATGCAMDLVPGYDPDDAMFVPIGYASLVQQDALSASLHARLSLQGPQGGNRDVVRFDIDLFDDHGNLLVAVRGLELRRLDAGFASAAKASGQVASHETPSEQAFLEILKAGIDAESGMDALDRVLSGQLPPVLTVSSIDLGRLAAIQEKAMAELGSGPAVKFERPQLSSAYAPPTDAIDRQLVTWWEELLGVEKVGIDDDFFEVGGHSLVAVRLFARIKKKWNLEYPLSLLFEAPTIRLCAEMLRAGLAHESEEGTESEDPRTALGLGSRYLVPLNDVRQSDRRPFFLVAGMFGNVLNLRHLATHLGADQPMYAIQARGLHGDDRPHRRFEDMARDYLEEIRRIQPEGPYLLGGFSGGGITAFEMAQQLHAEGEKTEALVLLDTPVTKIETASAVERFLIQCMRIRRGGFSYLLDWPKKRIAWELEKRRDKGDAVERGLAPAEFRSEMIQEGFVEALEHYQLRSYSGRLTLFRPPLDATFKLPRGRFANSYREIQDSNNFWDPFAAGGIDTFEVPGDHDSMVLEPHVRVLGSKVSEVLEAAQDRIEQDEA